MGDDLIQASMACRFCGWELAASRQGDLFAGAGSVDELSSFRLLDGTALCLSCRDHLIRLPRILFSEQQPLPLPFGRVHPRIVPYRRGVQRSTAEPSRLLAQFSKARPIYAEWPYDYPPDWEQRKKEVTKRDRRKCRYNLPECQNLPLHVHHKKRIAHGGNHALSNLETLCERHHAGQPGHGFLGRQMDNGQQVPLQF
jgi:hypothetical protein